MKYKIFSIITGSALLFLVMMSFKAPAGYVIQGSVNGWPSGKVYLSYEWKDSVFLDSANLSNGHFTFTGSVPEPVSCLLKLSGKEERTISFFIENANISIVADSPALTKVQIKGSATQDVAEYYTQVTAAIDRQVQRFNSVVDSVYKSEGAKPGKNTDDFIRHERNKLIAYEFTARKAFFKEHAGSVFCAYVVNAYYVKRGYELDKANELFSLLNDNVKQSYYGKQAQAVLYLQDRSGIGASPDFTLQDVNGKPVKLSSFKGKYVLVDFWASWCAPCRKENPNLVAAYRKYHAKGLDIVGVSLDTHREAWLKAIKADGLPWTQLSDLKGWNSKVVNYFGITVVPFNFLLDKSGRVIGKNLLDEALNHQLDTLFGH